ncbi:MAG TPA: 23S rRNA (adenine(2030)-N(6))-methyltransferase RlmJ [Opitutaceae bacterium]|jgi:23S rRNA (adenine2030-N6)-methyltransferase
MQEGLGVNYRHSFHAGNFADVFKHCLLVGLIRAMQAKEKGIVFVDTHAGRGAYDLGAASVGDTRPREPEWPAGIGRLGDAAGAPDSVAQYAALVGSFRASRGPDFYCGSPRIAAALARPQDRLELWEKQPGECAALRAEMAGVPRAAVHEADGYGAIRACLPPRERRGLVLLDPPFEDGDEWRSVAAALGEGVRRFPTGTYAVWHPLTERALPGDFESGLGALGAPALHAALVVDPGAAMGGCGVYIVNPPWKFDEEARLCTAYLAGVLQRAGAPQGSVRWIVSR